MLGNRCMHGQVHTEHYGSLPCKSSTQVVRQGLRRLTCCANSRNTSGRGPRFRPSERQQGYRTRDQHERRHGGQEGRNGRQRTGMGVHVQEPEPEDHATYQHNFFVTCHPGLEQVVAEELRALNIPFVSPGRAGVTFKSDSLADGYRANLWLRCAIRVLMKMGEGPLDPRQDPYKSLYSVVRDCEVQWHDIIPKGHTLSIEPRLWGCSGITSSRLVWQSVRDAVRDAIFDARGERLLPPQPDQPADVPLYVAAYNDHLTIYRDMSGDSLHRRGYRQGMHRSPLNEAAAAGLLMLSGWQTRCAQGKPAVLVDPMCGSGTILIEAAMMAHNIAPGLARGKKTGKAGFPCSVWPDVDKQAWRSVIEEAEGSKLDNWSGMLYGNDIHEGALGLAMHDIRQAGMTHCTRLHRGDCASWQLPDVPDLLVTNPPWGMRLSGETQDQLSSYNTGRQPARSPKQGSFGDASPDIGVEPEGPEELQACWRALSDFLRAQCPDTNASVLSGNKATFNYLRMKPFKKDAITIGGVDTHVYQFHVLPPKPKPQDQTDMQ